MLFWVYIGIAIFVGPAICGIFSCVGLDRQITIPKCVVSLTFWPLYVLVILIVGYFIFLAWLVSYGQEET